jgi:hypothetical protein
MEVSSQLHTLAVLPCGKSPQYPMEMLYKLLANVTYLKNDTALHKLLEINSN